MDDLPNNVAQWPQSLQDEWAAQVCRRLCQGMVSWQAKKQAESYVRTLRLTIIQNMTGYKERKRFARPAGYQRDRR
jgi:hypothetical protein